MQQINAFMRSLLQQLGSVEQGRGISVLEEALRATIDVRPYLGATNRRYINGTIANPNINGQTVGGPGSSSTNPNEVWSVLWFGANVTTDATGALGGMHLQYNRIGAAGAMPLHPSVNIGVNSRVAMGVQFSDPLLLLPGDLLQLRPNQLGANNHTWDWGILYDLVATVG